MPSLIHDLHVLVAVADRVAEGLVAAAVPGLSYRRYLVLLHICELDLPTQRQVAAKVGSSEAALSRMVAGLASAGLVHVGQGPGHRRALTLTEAGEQAVAAATAALGDSFDDLVRGVDLDPALLHDSVRRIIGALGAGPDKE